MSNSSCRTEVEKDWTTAAGLRAVILGIKFGKDTDYAHYHRNGYVLLPEGHEYFEIPYDSIPVSCHWGLTYGDNKLHSIALAEPCWVIGFDTAHCDDDTTNGGQSLEYCIRQCESIAEQVMRDVL